MGMLYSDLLLTTDAVARQHNVTDRAVRGWIDAGLLRAHRIGRQWLIDAQDARDFVLPQRGAPKKAKQEG